MKLADLKPCAACGDPIGIAFFRVQVEQHVVNMRAVQQHVGLQALLGGSQELAFAMGTDDDNSTVVMRDADLLLCTNCACTITPCGLLDRSAEKVL